MEALKINCECKDFLELAELTEFQGGLKQRKDVDFDKIKLSFVKYGFSFPFFVYKDGDTNWILDGHGRFATLCKMQKDGYEIPPLPVVYVDCKDKVEAKEKLLRLNSQYGKMSVESVLEFVGGEFEINAEEIALPFGTLCFQDEEIDLNFNDLFDEEKQRELQDTFQFALTFPLEYKEPLERYGRRNVEKDIIDKICRGEI